VSQAAEPTLRAIIVDDEELARAALRLRFATQSIFRLISLTRLRCRPFTKGFQSFF